MLKSIKFYDNLRRKNRNKVNGLPCASINFSTNVGETLPSKTITNHEESLYTTVNSQDDITPVFFPNLAGSR